MPGSFLTSTIDPTLGLNGTDVFRVKRIFIAPYSSLIPSALGGLT